MLSIGSGIQRAGSGLASRGCRCSTSNCYQFARSWYGELQWWLTNQQLPLDIDIDITEPGDVHRRVDVVGRWLEDDFPAATAPLECGDDGRGVVGFVCAGGWDDACLSGWNCCSRRGQGSDETKYPSEMHCGGYFEIEKRSPSC